MKRVAFYCTEPELRTINDIKESGGSGTSASLLYVALGLSELGHDISIFGICRHNMVNEENGVKFHHVSSRADFVKITHTDIFDVIIVVGHASEILEGKRLNSPFIIYWAHNWIDVKKRIDDCLAKKLDLIVFVSFYHFVKSWRSVLFNPFLLRYMTWIHNPLEIDFFKTKKEYGISLDSPSMVFLSYPSKNKGLPEAVEIFKKIRKRYSGATLHVFGSMELYSSQSSGYGECRELLLDSNDLPRLGIELHGLVGKKRLNESIVDMDVAIAGMTGSETFCLSLAEALACGVPVLTSRVGGQSDFVRDGRNGYAVPDIDSAVSVLIKYFESSESYRRQVGRFCRESVTKFDFNVISLCWNRLLMEPRKKFHHNLFEYALFYLKRLVS